jgi:hypothetical protein
MYADKATTAVSFIILMFLLFVSTIVLGLTIRTVESDLTKLEDRVRILEGRAFNHTNDSKKR